MTLKKQPQNRKSKQTEKVGSDQQEFKQQKQQPRKKQVDKGKIHYLNKVQKLKVSGPTLIEVEGGVTVYVDYNNCVTIQGNKNVRITTPEDFTIKAKTIDMEATEHMVMKSARIDLNPKE